MRHVISPHLDDAVLSLGQTILGLRPKQVQVVTAFAGKPKPGTLTPYDKARGFAASSAAVTTRRIEDKAACAALGASTRHLTFLDGQYARHDEVIFEALVMALRPLWDGAGAVFAPLGIGHPDHEFVRKAALRAMPYEAQNERVGVWLYEELPYRVLNPEQAQAALGAVREEYEVQDLPAPLPQGSRATKEQAIACYASQFPDGADDPCLLVPERCWHVAKRRNDGNE